ncbi:Alcohol acetyltransferase [Aspergillus melleus]|uniref:Alcohol acetyltransferase n=1 Tax=Aspergillus melleus TaxID=138277 RepID=A0ACC3APP1_9EURO|nr:Alcohol acetyltransferase [Aspergillus melleus]
MEYSESLRCCRPLGPIEQYSAFRSHLGIYLNVCVTAIYQREDEKPIKPALFRALAAVIEKHPILSAVPVDIPTGPRFARLDQIDLDQVVIFSEVQGCTDSKVALDQMLEDQHNRPFQHRPRTPFWRVRVLEDPNDRARFILCFCFHHALADTKSALVFHEDLEHELSKPGDGAFVTIIAASQAPLLPNIEAIHNLPISPRYLASQQQDSHRTPETWSGAPQNLPVRTRVSSMWIPSATLADVKQQCKVQKTTVTALLMSLIARSFFHVLPAEYTSIQGDSAMSLRHFLPLPITSHSMGCYIGTFNEQYMKTSESVWQDARRTKMTIDRAVGTQGADMPLGYLGHVPNMAQWFLDKIGKPRAAGFELSNVGFLQSERSCHRYGIQSLLFSQSAGACSAAVKISAVTGRDGRMGVAFSWQEGVVADNTVNEVMQTLEKLVEEMVQSKD